MSPWAWWILLGPLSWYPIFKQGWGQVKYLVLDANYQVLGTYLYLTFWNSKVLGTYLYLMAKVLDTFQVLKYFCQINKYFCEFVLVNNSPLNTISRNGSYWVRWEHMSQDVNSQGWTVCLLDLQAQNWDPMTQYTDKILAIIGSGSDLSPVWRKPPQPNW